MPGSRWMKYIEGSLIRESPGGLVRRSRSFTQRTHIKRLSLLIGPLDDYLNLARVQSHTVSILTYLDTARHSTVRWLSSYGTRRRCRALSTSGGSYNWHTCNVDLWQATRHGFQVLSRWKECQSTRYTRSGHHRVDRAIPAEESRRLVASRVRRPSK
jgi:hypothetical protein